MCGGNGAGVPWKSWSAPGVGLRWGLGWAQPEAPEGGVPLGDWAGLRWGLGWTQVWDCGGVTWFLLLKFDPQVEVLTGLDSGSNSPACEGRLIDQ